MGAKIADLRDAVVDFINNETYSQSFTATAANVPSLELEETNDVVVTVFPGEFEEEGETRGDWRLEITINIAVQKAITALTAAARLIEEDAMLLLREEIADSLKNENMGTYEMNTISGDGVAQIPFNQEHLIQAGHFTSVIGVTYRA
jgi:hypothetical protein